MTRPIPNGRFIRDFIVWGALNKSPTITRGFVLTPPDSRGLSEASKVRTHEALVKYLQGINPDIRVQIQWRCNCDYHAALNAYDAVTAECKNPHEKKLRESTSRYFWTLLRARKLRREHLVIFISQKLASAPPLLAGADGIRRYFTSAFAQQENAFEQYRSELAAGLGAETSVEPMTKRDHQLYTFLFFNPSANEWDSLQKIAFDPRASILRNCLNSDIVPDATGRLVVDGHLNALLILRQLGSHTYEGMSEALTKTDFLNYQITVNIAPLDTQKIIAREETEQGNLQKQQHEDRVVSQTRLDTITRKQKIITELGEGHTRLFHTTFVIRVWNSDPNQLAADVSAIKQALIGMKSARVYETHLEATSLEVFAGTFPGNSFHPYNARALEIADMHLANLLPYSSSFTGDLPHAQALFLSANNDLVGFRYHVNGLVQHTGIAGGSRAGKSLIYNNTLYQTGNYFDYDVMLEEGASHTNYTEDHGCKPFVIQKSGNVTINYLDTAGLPLDPEHLAYAISLTAHFAGVSKDDHRLNSRRRSYLSYYLNILYRESSRNWAKHHPEENRLAQREAAAVAKWHRTRMTPEDTMFDAYTFLRDAQREQRAEALEFLASITEAEITHFQKDHQTAHLAERHAFAKFTTEQYPRHSDLAELLRLRPAEDHDRAEVLELADSLDNWSLRGEYGQLFDGPTNRRFDGRVVHFELAKADNNDAALRGAIALNITGRIRQQIVAMPRALKKRFTMEELARLVQMPNGAKLALELSAQLAKYNCVFAFILQDFAQIAHIEGISTLLNNTRQWLITRHDDEDELKLFANRISLPDSMRDAVREYPIPLNLPPGKRFSGMCYFSRSAAPQISGSIRYHLQQNAA